MVLINLTVSVDRESGVLLKRLGEFGGGIRRVIASVVLLLILIISVGGLGGQKFFLPLFTYAVCTETGPVAVLGNSLMSILPICEYGRGSIGNTAFYTGVTEAEREMVFDTVEDENGEESRALEGQAEMENVLSASGELPEEALIAEALTLEELLVQENAESYRFTPAKQVAEYDWASMEDYETLLSTFYTVDRYALAGSDILNINALKDRDITIKKTDAAPQILIYHTHSKEAFCDSVPGDASQTIVGVGDFLTKLLTEEYGYSVLHHTEEYDTVRDDAYAKSLPAIEQLLQENPSIQVVIDLHRDAGNAERNMVVDIDGRKTARFMFFNGISRSTKTGAIDYLENPNLADNLAFSFQMQAAAGEYYPGLTRKIYIKQYRYNMHLRGRSLLIELGDENNTVQEAKNACYPLAHLLDMVLSGSEQ
ncbi:MAG: stage II sporulation protein P [Lachnospiraceae bacterium]